MPYIPSLTRQRKNYPPMQVRWARTWRLELWLYFSGFGFLERGTSQYHCTVTLEIGKKDDGNQIGAKDDAFVYTIVSV